MKIESGKSLRWILWSTITGLIIITGLIYFPREDQSLEFPGSLYYTIRLFIMEHDLDHFPKSWPLIFIYFLAPVVAITAVGTIISYFFRISPVLKTRFISGHVIICGLGRAGKLVAATLKKKGVQVVGIDLGPSEQFEEWYGKHKVPVLFGDFLSHSILQKAGADRARSIIFVSGNDLLNLEGVISLYGWLEQRRVKRCLLWVHIANERLAETARSALRTKGNISIRIFDTYKIASEKMIDQYFSSKSWLEINEITILGYGKFGRDLFEVLENVMTFRENQTINIVDIHDREKEIFQLANELGLSNQITFIKSNIYEIDLVDGVDKAFFLCTDDDIGNLSAALMLTKSIHATHIYVRMTTWPMPAIESHLRENRGINFVNINNLVEEGIKKLPGIFASPDITDMKRTDTE